MRFRQRMIQISPIFTGNNSFLRASIVYREFLLFQIWRRIRRSAIQRANPSLEVWPLANPLGVYEAAQYLLGDVRWNTKMVIVFFAGLSNSLCRKIHWKWYTAVVAEVGGSSSINFPLQWVDDIFHFQAKRPLVTS